MQTGAFGCIMPSGVSVQGITYLVKLQVSYPRFAQGLDDQLVTNYFEERRSSDEL